MPMVDICGSSGGNKIPQFAVRFLSEEKKDDYMWIMNFFAELLREYEIPMPKFFATDRELALLNSLDELFPDTDHILCCWHINMNGVAKTKKLFKNQEAFDDFYGAWNVTINSVSFEAYSSNLVELREHKTMAVKNVEITWLIWREKIVSYWMNRTSNFGNKTTSWNELSHAVIKAYLNTTIGDHKYISDALCLFWEDQQRNIWQQNAQQKMIPRHAVKIQLFRDVVSSIHPFALLKFLEEKAELPEKPLDTVPLPCYCKIEQSMELPCFLL